MQIPPEKVVELFARRGRIFAIKDGEFFDGDKWHYHVVCNDAVTGQVVVLVIATSNVAGVVKFITGRHQAETVVHFGADEYEFFNQPTAFNCNDPKTITIEELVRLTRDKELRVIDGILSPEHIDKIEAGIRMSRAVEPEIKELVQSVHVEVQ